MINVSSNILMFGIFSVIVIIFSFFTIFSRRILRAAVSLLFVLIATAGLYFMLDYQFLAGIQLALYAGGIVVLIIFSILLTSAIKYKLEAPQLIYLISGGIVAVAGAALSINTIINYTFKQTTAQALNVNMSEIGRQMLSTERDGYALPFEVISVLLLAAMIAAIIIAKKGK